MTPLTALKAARKYVSAILPAATRPRADFVKYRNSPVDYCRDVLHVGLTDQQQSIVNAVAGGKPILCPSANETGKSYVQACLASWHYDCWNPGLTIVTAPNAEQIRDTVFAELRMLRPWDTDWMPAAMWIESAPDHWIKGRTSRHSTGFQGRHIGGHTFVIFEEAEEIAGEFWVAADSMAHFFAAFYNPILTSSEAAEREYNSKYTIVRLSAIDHPNIAAQLAGRLPVVPNAITLERLLDRLDKWATRIEKCEQGPDKDICIAGRCYRCGPIAQARVLGVRPTDAVGSVFGQELIDILTATRHHLRGDWPVVLGLDVARDGDDDTAIHARKGLCSIHHERHNGWHVPQTIERIQVYLDEICNGSTYEAKRIPIHVDDIGYGGAATDYLLRDGYNAIPINVGCNANPEFPNLRSQLWFDSADLVRAGMVDVSRLDPEHQAEICRQLKAPKYEYKTYSRGGRKYTGRCVEEKKKTKSTLGYSPDDADAFNLAYHVPTPAMETAE